MASVHPLFFEGPDQFFHFSTLLQSAMAIVYGFIFHIAACRFCQHTAGSAPYCFLVPCACPPDQVHVSSWINDLHSLLAHSYALAAKITKEAAYLTEQFFLELRRSSSEITVISPCYNFWRLYPNFAFCLG